MHKADNLTSVEMKAGQEKFYFAFKNSEFYFKLSSSIFLATANSSLIGAKRKAENV